ncbi:PREDICTED: uncharacterized protein LOC108374880 [Rhagoletis zephyria]|uniref:uncharacterized protein LOC108374880 n=1 Tax=Rhagoletis zephyria TaxID=28612 RepID=UPI0008119C26|nr:PREDICTED: uncharacterized protein LOC108374880 [Rhagoletis zephyria]XP_017486404.1 PREDICTED: uncharacterized protein LOC108374880 [Rhagoletis zephyria]XP_017486405.1 PREDICTED: uncharacterized protein LOC108374880 [Rhagoletis zephyria]
MKKVARLRIPQQDDGSSTGGQEHVGVRTTGRIKKPKAVFDPSDNYLPRSQRANIAATAYSSGTGSPASGTYNQTDRKRDTPTSNLLQSQDAQQNKRLSQSSTASGSTNAGSTPEIATADVCDVCQKREAKRGTHAKNKLITCLQCERRVHKLCLPVDFEDVDVLRQYYKCENCRKCDLCDAFADCEPKINQPMVTCSKCVKSYHLTCHIPNVYKFQQIFRWKCNKCQPSINNVSDLPVKTIREIIGDEPQRAIRTQLIQQQQQQQNVSIAAAAAEAKSTAAKLSLQETQKNGENGQKQDNGGPETDASYLESGGSSTTSSSTASSSSEEKVADVTASKRPKPNHDETVNITPAIRYSPYEPIDVPDVKDWNVDQVASYFAKYFPKEAHVFKEHEIDGTSLLLLKRSDVIKKLPIKLGPSLRIYSLILKIQTQLNDPTLGWNCGL